MKRFFLFTFLSIVLTTNIHALSYSCPKESERFYCQIGISSVEEFNNLNNYLTENEFCYQACGDTVEIFSTVIRLEADLNFSSEAPDSSCSSNLTPIRTFSGTFDGNGKKMSGICLKVESESEISEGGAPLGIFQNNYSHFELEDTLIISDLTIENAYVEGLSNAPISLLLAEKTLPVKLERLHLSNIAIKAAQTSMAAENAANATGLLIGYDNAQSSTEITAVHAEKISIQSNDALYVGGFIGQAGFYDTYIKESFAEIQIESSPQVPPEVIEVESKIYIGGLIGSANAPVFLKNDTISLEQNWNPAQTWSSDTLSIGGVLGYSTNSLQLQNVSVNASLLYGSGSQNEKSPILAMGGFSGSIIGLLAVQSSSFNGTLTANNLNKQATVFAGGFAGIANFSYVLRNSYAASPEKLVSATFESTLPEQSSPIVLGGLIGYAGMADSAIIEQSFVRGQLVLNATANVTPLSSVSIGGFLGEINSNVSLSNTYFGGTIQNDVGIKNSALFNASPMDVPTFQIESHYTLDTLSNITQLFYTGEDATLDTFAVYLYHSLKEAGLPKAASNLNNGTNPSWYYSKADNGLPQLLNTPAQTGYSPTFEVSFLQTTEDQIAKVLYKAYSGTDGHLAYDSLGAAFKADDLPPAYKPNADSTTLSYYISYGEDGAEIWKKDSSLILSKNTVYYLETASIPKISFAYQIETEGDEYYTYLENATNPYWWNGASFSLFSNDSLPKIIYQKQDLDGTDEFMYTNSWIISEKSEEIARCQTTECLLEIIATFGFEEMVLVKNETESEYYSSTEIELNDLQNVSLQYTFFDEVFYDTTISQTLRLPKPAYLQISAAEIPEDYPQDSVVVVLNDTLTLAVALNDSIPLGNGITMLQIFPKIEYSIRYDFSAVSEQIFRTSELPTSYFYKQETLEFPELKSLSACYTPVEEAGDIVVEDQIGYIYNYQGDVVFSLQEKENCQVDTNVISLELDSLVTVNLSHFGEPLSYENNQVYLPAMENLPIEIRVAVTDTSVLLDSILLDHSPITDSETVYISKDALLRVKTFTKPLLPTVANLSSNVQFAGSAVRFVMQAESNDTTGLNLQLRIYNASELLVDTTFSGESLSNTTYDFYPLPPGEYKASVQLSSKKEVLAEKEHEWTVASVLNSEVSPQSWQILSFAALADTFDLLRENTTVYFWDEENPIGDYWQYRRLTDLKQTSPQKGYWFFSEDSVSLPLTNQPQKAQSDTVSWPLKHYYSGWNLIANPYAWNLYAGSESAFLDAENDEFPLFAWDAKTSEYQPVDTLKAYSGAWIYAKENAEYQLSSKPVFPSSEVKSVLAKEKKSPSGWALRLKLESKKFGNDTWNVIGCGTQDITLPKPPAGLDQSVFLEIQSRKGAASKSILKKESDFKWDLLLKSSKAQEAYFSVEGIQDLQNAGYKATLTADGQIYPLEAKTKIPLYFATSAKSAQINVFKPSETVISQGIEGLRFQVLGDNLQIRFSLPESLQNQEVHIRLIDALGIETDLKKFSGSLGENQTVLNAPKQSGVYFLNVSVGKFSKTRSLKF